ncbi:hypothetical protein ScPMuIL_015499 [Solemya velum]
MSAPRPSCLVVLSSAIEGVSAQSFVQAYTLLSPSFTLQLASPQGRVVEFINQDETNRRWFNEFRSKSSSMPIGLDTVDPVRYTALLVPATGGALHDLISDKDMAQIVSHFILEKKPVCAIGLGVAALCGAKTADKKAWVLENYSLTAPSVYELARTPDFSSMPVILEDFVKDNGARYSCSEPDGVHVVIDRHVVTGQNTQSSLIAVQNLILICSQKQGKVASMR